MKHTPFKCIAAIAIIATFAASQFFSVPIQNLCEFIAGTNSAHVVRKIVVLGGIVMIAISSLYALNAVIRKRHVAVIASDADALTFFLYALPVLSLSCFSISASTHCDFLMLQSATSLFLFLYGSIVAIRAKRYRYIVYYFLEFALLSGLAPAM